MIHRVASVLLVVALVLAGGSEPSRHMRQTRRSPRRELVGGAVAAARHLHGYAAGTNTLVGDRHHHLSVPLATVAVAHPNVRVGATPALVGVWEARIVPDLPGQPVPVAANARPNRPPRVVLPARAPPVSRSSAAYFPNPVCKKSAHHCRPSTEDGCWEVTTSRPAVGGIP